MILMPFVFFLELLLIFYQKKSWREAFVWAAVWWAFFLIATLEILSLFNAIRFFPLGMAWMGGTLVLGLVLWKFRPLKWQIDLSIFRSGDFLQKLMLVAIGLIFFITLATALIAPPNNYDSMTYHMSRVAHWAQNHSLAHYPTFILRQLAMTPAAEFMILNFQVLLGNDYLANFVQWFCMLGSIIVVSLIAKLLGADLRGQILAAFIAAAIPMGIMQATSTQNDYVAAFWILSFAFFVVRSSSGNFFLNIMGASIALGLAMLTKLTAYFFALPFGAWLLVVSFKKNRWNFWKPLLFLLIVITVINAGYFTRNLQVFNSITGPNYGTVNEKFAIKNFASNVLKYFSMHLNTPFPFVNSSIYNGISRFHDVLGVDLNDKRTSAYGEFKVRGYAPHEDVIGNPMHLFLIFICGAFLFWRGETKKNPKLLVYFISVVTGFLIFFIFLKYQLGFYRLTLPIFVLFSPIIGITLNKIASKKALLAVLIVAFIFTVPPLLMNITRPLIPPPLARRSKYSILNTPRQFFYFGGGKIETYKNYLRIVDTIKTRNYKNIGVIRINNEYSLWALLKDSGVDFRLEHLDVGNVSGAIPSDFDPSVVICFGPYSMRRNFPGFNYAYKADLGKDNLGSKIRLYGK